MIALLDALFRIILLVLQLYTYVIIIVAVMSWLIAFNVINIHNNFVRSLWNAMNGLTEPLLRPIRQFLPNLGGLDISPVVLLLIIQFFEYFIQNIYLQYIRPSVFWSDSSVPLTLPWSERNDGLTLVTRLTPKSSRDGIDGIATLADGRAILKVRVRVVPEAGAANAALLVLLAKSLKLPGSSLTLATGATARLKTIHIAGNPAELAESLAALVDSCQRK
jgi:YggT family protein